MSADLTASKSRTGVFRKYAWGVFSENRFLAFVFSVQKYALGRLIRKIFF